MGLNVGPIIGKARRRRSFAKFLTSLFTMFATVFVTVFVVVPILLGTLLPDWSVDDLVHASDVVVVGTLTSSNVTTEDGQFFTTHEIAVKETLLGPPAKTVRVRQHGGVKEGATQSSSRVAGDVRLDVGTTVLLFTFLDRTTDENGVRFIAGLSLGAFTFLDDDTVVQTIDADLITTDGDVLRGPNVREFTLASVRRATKDARLARAAEQKKNAIAGSLNLGTARLTTTADPASNTEKPTPPTPVDASIDLVSKSDDVDTSTTSLDAADAISPPVNNEDANSTTSLDDTDASSPPTETDDDDDERAQP